MIEVAGSYHHPRFGEPHEEADCTPECTFYTRRPFRPARGLPAAHCSVNCPTGAHQHYRAVGASGGGSFKLADGPCWWCALPDAEPHRHFVEDIPRMPSWRRLLRLGRKRGDDD
jgi:hypothetical protein